VSPPAVSAGSIASPSGAIARAGALLRALGDGDAAGAQSRSLVPVVGAAGAVYGAFMGSYALQSLERVRMVAYAAVKVPLLIAATTAVCLPAFFVFNTVAGLRGAFGRALRAVVAGQAATTVALASLAPCIGFAYASGVTHQWALIANSAFFTLATIAGQRVLARHYRPLVEEHPSHRVMLRLWLALYSFVGMQMGWTLRPFVGAPDVAVTFFRAEPFSNAYVVIAHLFF
jgi:hypothetical protein